MLVHEVHLVNEGVIKINSPYEVPVVVEAADNLLKFQYANGTTYTFVTANVLYYVTKRGVG